MFKGNMYDKEQSTAPIKPDNGVTGFVIPRRIHQLQKGIEEGLDGVRKSDAVLAPILFALDLVPYKVDSVQHKTSAHCCKR